MKTYNTQAEIDADIIEGKLIVDDNITITFDCTIGAHIEARDIKARDIKARNIKAWDINARNIKAWDIKAWDIKAWDINAWGINARDINAGDIKARDIKAWDINAVGINVRDISYFALCSAYETFTCQKIEGKRKNAKHFCLDSEIKKVKGEQNG